MPKVEIERQGCLVSDIPIDSVSIFGHGGIAKDGQGKMYMNEESLSANEILKLQKFNYNPNAKIDIRTCRSGLSEHGKSSVTNAFFKSQNVNTVGMQNYATLSKGATEKIGINDDKEESFPAYLDTFNYNLKGLKKGYSVFPFLSGMTEHQEFIVTPEFVTPKYPDIPGTAELKE